MRPLYFAIIILIIIVVVAVMLFSFFRTTPKEEIKLSELPASEKISEEKPTLPQAAQFEEIKEKNIEELPVFALIQITNEPISGFKPLKDGKARFVDKSTGHVFEVNLLNGGKEIISNTTLPKIFEVKWSEDAKKSLFKYLEEDEVKTVSAEFSGTPARNASQSEAGGSTKGFILPQNILSFGYVPGSDNIFYLVPTGDNQENGTIIRATYKNQSQREIYSSPFADFIVSFQKSDVLSLVTRPSGVAPGFLYQYNLSTGNFKKILGDILGLEAKWDKKGEKFAFSGYDANNQKPVLGFYDLKKQEVLSPVFSGLAQKCAFSQIDADIVYCAVPKNPSLALYPDEWHQGLASLEDEFFKINLKTGETKTIYNERPFDVWEIEVAPNEDFLYFKDKEQEFLWAIKIR